MLTDVEWDRLGTRIELDKLNGQIPKILSAVRGLKSLRLIRVSDRSLAELEKIAGQLSRVSKRTAALPDGIDRRKRARRKP